ncbi:trehalose-phosphatase [Omnitrophica bacterium]|nr:trehalose-phosphatase [Candidatus Omnitrophota bacterium]
MKYLFNDWTKIRKLIGKSPYVLLLADYDGTLTPIVSRPQDAAFKREMKGLLKRLSKKKGFRVGVISGRMLSDVKRLVGLRGIYYSGDHGFEIRGPGISYLHASGKRYASCLAGIRKKLLSKTKGIKGVIIEKKVASLSLHYRMVRRGYVPHLRRIFETILNPYLNKRMVNLTSGKMVWEVRLPGRWNKGQAALKILKVIRRRKKTLPIYLGDDKTDEDAFSSLRQRKSITVFVGKRYKKSRAKYYLRSPYDVEKFLVRLCRI